jgi:hypothetical protein
MVSSMPQVKDIETMHSHFLLSDLTQSSRSAVGRGSFKYSSAMTKHFAILVVSGTCDRGSDSFEDTQVRQHATEYGESSGGLLV